MRGPWKSLAQVTPVAGPHRGLRTTAVSKKRLRTDLSKKMRRADDDRKDDGDDGGDLAC